EIILSDDCSTDRTFEIMEEMARAYEGPHRVVVRRGLKNVGIGPHVTAVASIANGAWLALAAGDDISMPHRVTHAMSILARHRTAHPRAHASILSTSIEINDKGYTNTGHHWSMLDVRPTVASYKTYRIRDLLRGALTTSGPTRLFPLSLHSFFGPIASHCFTEDIVLLLRTAMLGAVLYISAPTVFRRVHGDNMSHPENLYFRDFRGVKIQLLQDLKVAQDRGIIDQQTALAILKWIEAHAAYRRFRRAKLQGDTPSWRDFFTLMRAPHLSLRRKFGLLREHLGIR
ncbi:MAG: glycosyltransferase, partial [Chloroflexi bacterium]